MNIDQAKLAKISEAAGWLKQAELHYKGAQHEIADGCVKRAKVAINDPCFDRQPIPGFTRDQQPEVVRIEAATPLGYAIINSSDYDGETMKLYVEPTPPVSGKRSK